MAMTIEQEIEQLVLKCIALDGLKACPKDLAFLEKYGLKNLYFFSLEYAMEGTDTTVLDSKAKRVDQMVPLFDGFSPAAAEV